MINALIIDDEADAHEALRLALTKYCPDVLVQGVFETPEEGLDAIRNLQPNLVFLDVQMPRMSGFDVLQQVLPVTFDVIFVSAYDQYAIKAIKFSALDYLLKPIDIDELMHAVERVKTGRLSSNASSHLYQSVLNNIQHKSGKIERLAIPTFEGINFFNTNDIIFCKAEGSYTTLVMQNKQSELVSKNLKDFESLLSESGFCRVHHSYLVNMKHVQKYVKGEGGYVIMTEGHHVDLSRRKKEEFLKLLDKL